MELGREKNVVTDSLGAMGVGVAGYHGGKLIFDHGIGLMVSPDD